MPVVGSAISFGGYQLPIGAQFKKRDIDSTIDETQMLGRDGTYAPTGAAAAGTVEVDVVVGGGSFSVFTGLELITVDDINNELNRIYAQLASGYQQLVLDTTPARYCLAQKQKMSIDYLESTNRTFATMAIAFYLADPRWLSLTAHEVNPIDTIATTITNAGSVRTFPEFNFVGPSTGNPTALVTPAGAAGMITFTCGVGLIAGDVLNVQCDPRTPYDQRMTLNGVNRIDLLGATGITNTVGDDFCFPYLNPGDNIVSIRGASDPSSYVAWPDAYGL